LQGVNANFIQLSKNFSPAPGRARNCFAAKTAVKQKTRRQAPGASVHTSRTDQLEARRLSIRYS